MTRLGFEILTYQNSRMMKKETKQQNSTDTQMGYDTVLAPPVSRNFLRRGDKVRMKDGKILTVKFLEYTDFICEEIVGYIPKKDIDTVME